MSRTLTIYTIAYANYCIKRIKCLFALDLAITLLLNY